MSDEAKDDVVNSDTPADDTGADKNQLLGGETDATPDGDKAEGDKPDADKPDADEKADGGDTDDKESGESPENYEEFTLPDGVTLDETSMAEATDVFKELNLNQEQAQKLTDLVSAKVQRDVKAQQDKFESTKQGWETQTRNDEEIGGDKLEQSVADAKLALQKFGTPELVEVLETFGLGNHPEMIRCLARMGNILKEDNGANLPGKTSTSSESKDRASVLYPSDEK